MSEETKERNYVIINDFENTETVLDVDNYSDALDKFNEAYEELLGDLVENYGPEDPVCKELSTLFYLLVNDADDRIANVEPLPYHHHYDGDVTAEDFADRYE